MLEDGKSGIFPWSNITIENLFTKILKMDDGSFWLLASVGGDALNKDFNP